MFNLLAKLISNIKSTAASHSDITIIPKSKINIIVLQFLLDYKIINKFRIYNDSKCYLVFVNKNSIYTSKIKLISKSSLKKFITLRQLYTLIKNYYLGLISTSIGILTLNEAFEKKKSGLLLLLIKL